MRSQVFSFVLASALAVSLSACGGSGGSSAAAQADTTAGTFVGTAPDTTASITVSDPQVVKLPDGGVLPAMFDALVVGDHIVVRSQSASVITVNGKQLSPRTRLSLLDKDGKLTASTDYGFALAPGYTGDWLMMPSPDGFVMVQSGPGTKLLHFDAQAKLVGGATDLYQVAADSSSDLSAAESGAAMDGNGFWLATTFSRLPITDKTQYLLKLCKFDFNGRQLTPPIEISTSALHPRVAASGGAVLTGWLENGGAMLAMWPKGLGAPVIRSLATGGSQPYPTALDTNGKMGVLWHGKATTTSPGGVIGVAVDNAGAPVLSISNSDLSLESLSGQWKGNVRGPDFDARIYKGRLLLADIAVGSYNAGDPVGDFIVLADYGVGTAALTAQKAYIERARLTGQGAGIGSSPLLRQMLFADHAMLLLGDENQLRTIRVVRN
jgi:hypothetical protein